MSESSVLTYTLEPDTEERRRRTGRVYVMLVNPARRRAGLRSTLPRCTVECIDLSSLGILEKRRVVSC
jgi:hypothetical protein